MRPPITSEDMAQAQFELCTELTGCGCPDCLRWFFSAQPSRQRRPHYKPHVIDREASRCTVCERPGATAANGYTHPRCMATTR